jgi:hypothetical protein
MYERKFKFNLDAYAKLNNPDTIQDYITDGIYHHLYRDVQEFNKDFPGTPHKYLINVTVYEIKEGSL